MNKKCVLMPFFLISQQMCRESPSRLGSDLITESSSLNYSNKVPNAQAISEWNEYMFRNSHLFQSLLFRNHRQTSLRHETRPCSLKRLMTFYTKPRAFRQILSGRPRT